MPCATLRFYCQSIIVGVTLLNALNFSWTKTSECVSPRLQYSLPYPGGILATCFSHDNKYLACASTGWPGDREKTPAISHGQLTLWNMQTGHLLKRKLLRHWIDDLAFAPDDKTLVSIGYQERIPPHYTGQSNLTQTHVQVWAVASLQLMHTLAHEYKGRGIAFLSRRPLVAIGNGQKVILYNTHTWQKQRGLQGFRFGDVADVAFFPGGKMVAGVCVGGEPGEGELGLWEVSSGRRQYWSGVDNRWAEELDSPMTFLEGGQYVACGAMKLRTHPVSGPLQPVLPAWTKYQQGCLETCLAYSSQGSIRAITGCYYKNNGLNIWDIERRQLYCHWNCDRGALRGFSPNGKLIATQADDSLKIWVLK